MENLKKTLESGVELTVSLASFPEGHRLFKAVTKELQSINLAEDTVQKLSMQLVSSDAIEQALWPCMARATYNGLKVNPELFENAEARCDFLEIMKEVLAYNLVPFSKNLGSLSTAIFRKDTDILT